MGQEMRGDFDVAQAVGGAAGAGVMAHELSSNDVGADYIMVYCRYFHSYFETE